MTGTRPGGRRSGVGALTLTAIVFIAIALVSCTGCATTIIPPRDVREPVTVYLADYGRHPSIVLPHSETVLVEYTYGEWQWYALDHAGVLGALRAMMIPTQGTLGRRFLDRQPGVVWWEGLGYANLYAIEVERERAEALRARLDDRWAQREETSHYNPLYDLDFVHDPQLYHLINNSNPTTARWLEELGCDVRGPALMSCWRIAE